MSDLFLRDFMYLDIDKIRSFVAQANEGYPDAVEKSTNQKGGVGVSVLDYAMERSSTETISVHHHLYSILERYLLAEQRTISVGVGAKPFDWTRDNLLDGRFVLAEGNIRLLDFRSMATAMAGIPQMMKAWNQIQESQNRKKLANGDLTRAEFNAESQRTRRESIESSGLDQVKEMIRSLYGETLSVRLYPAATEGGFFSANLKPEYLQRHQADVFGASGLASAGTWRIFGLIDRYDQTSAPTAPEGNASLEDAMVAMFEVMSTVSKIAASIDWPTVPLTPLAIYRLV